VIVLAVVAEETREGGAVDLLRHAGLVVFQIAGPQTAPLGLVGGGERADGRGHEVSTARLMRVRKVDIRIDFAIISVLTPYCKAMTNGIAPQGPAARRPAWGIGK